MKDEGADKPLKTEKEVITMEKTKMTYVAALNTVLDTCTLDPEVAEKLTALKDSIAKRNAKPATRKPTKAQRENEIVKTQIADTLATFDEGVQAKTVADAMGLSVQKISALLRQMVEDGIVIKTVGAKKVSLFALPVADAE